jgi:hypothetical protein
MSRNLPLDANDEDLIQRGLRRPSLDDVLLPVQNTFTAVRAQYDNAAAGLVSVDNIWPIRHAEELANLDAAQRREYLEQRGLVPPIDSIPYDQVLSNVDEVVSTLGNPTEAIESLNTRLDAALNPPRDSYGQPLTGPTVQPTPITAPPPGGSYTPPGTQPTTGGTGSVYNYTPIDLYDDRYDFNTGQVVRKGVATGAKGGVGQEDRPGNTVSPQGQAGTQQEPVSLPPNVTQNDTTPGQYDDAILRQARAQEYSSPTVNNETTARVAQQEDQTVDYTDNTEADTGNWTPPARTTETAPPVQRASRAEIQNSRTQTSQDIKEARRNGVVLSRQRRPDGTYYAAPASDISNNKNLPQRIRDF